MRLGARAPLLLPLAALLGGMAAFLLAAAALELDPTQRIVFAGFGIAAVPALILLWHADPAWVFTVAVVLSPFAANWPAVGVPGALAPDRLLLIAAIGLILLRAPAVRDRPRFEPKPVHWVLLAALLYAVLSALAAGTLAERAPFFRLLEAYGLLPFAVFAFAPFAFDTEPRRRVLVWGLTGLGAYLGFTALAEGLNLDALVFPKYILDPSFGIHADYARGPFVEASTNGLALVCCAAAAVIGALSFNRSAERLACIGVTVLCVPGAFFTMERSVWLGAVIAGLAALVAVPRLRRIGLASVLAAAALVALILVAAPTLREQATERLGSEGSVYDRFNMNAAAANMVEERPLLGFGWGGYAEQRFDYYEQSPEYPMTGEQNDLVHNVVLNNLAELGILGTALWLLGLGMIVWGAIRVRSRLPDVALWSSMFPSVAIMTSIVLFFTPIKPFATLIICVWAAAIAGGALQGERELTGRSVEGAPS